jgi:tripartite-type tricarboxylate transporter receptor subunit TctC
MNPHLFKALPYDPLKDFIPLAGTMKSALLMNVGPSVPFKSAKEFFAAAKANPGKYTYASVSATTRLGGFMLAKAAGITMVNVPYKNYGDLISNLLAGKIDVLMADAPGVGAYYSQGVRSLASCTVKRVRPELPTLDEEGLKGLEIYGWHGTYVPANAPAAAVTALREAVRQAARSKYVKDYLTNFGVEPLDLVGDQFAAFQQAEYDKWGAAIREAGMAGTL